MKKKEKKTGKKVVVSKEKYDKLLAENEKLEAENDKLESHNANLEKVLFNQKKSLSTLSYELFRLKVLIEIHNKRLFSRRIKF